MSDISNQLIKNSYDYVLQSDLSTGIVYRIGGAVPVNPIFLSGLTINSGFTYSDGTEQNGYVLTCDPFGNAKWAPVSGTTPTSGVTSITAGPGLSGNSTTGAVTIINTAPDQTVTITGGTNIQINGTYPNFGIDFTGTTGGGDYLPLSGGTVTGGTIFQSGLTANTISATTYQNLPFSGTVTGGGTTNYVPKWTGSTGLGNSQIFDNGTNVGIGTISPSAKLDVSITGGTIGVRISGDSSSDMLRLTQTGSGNAILVEDSSNPDATPFVVASDGKVGIGTTSPQYFLEAITTGGVDAVMLFDGGIAANANLVARADTTQKLPVVVMSDRNNAYGVNTSFYIGLDRSPSSQYAGRNDSIYVNNYTDKGHYFVTTNSVGTKSVKMSILGNGNVGIGTTSPSARLDVSGDTLLRSGVTLSNLSSSANTRFIVSDSNGVLSYRTDVLTGTTITISGGTGITTGGTYPNFTITNSAPDQTVTISGGTGITTGGTYPNFTLVNSAPDQTVTITGGTNIQINGSYPNFGIDFTGGTILKYYISATTPTGIINNGDRWFNTTDGVELVYVTDGDGPQWVQPNNGGSNTGTTSGGDYLPISGGTVTGNTTFSSGVALNALTSSEEINNIVADSAGNLYTYTDGVTISAGSDPAVNSGMFKTNRIVDIGGTFYRVYNIKANVTVPGANNTFVNYIGVVSGSTNYTPSLTKSLVIAQDPTFNRVQTPLTTYALVYDETLLFAAPVDLMTVNYDNTLGNPDEYYIFSIAANTNNFSCDLQVDYEFLVLETDVITFTN
jgi:hypothetical protein